ncbi:hypothetical protein [Micromonospora tarensis]|uniref:Uncharacterized protein n=1 Tax=Micromonospora tarensis TaxID=2806100 RepID=A0ABS1YEG3_9ACTN|nr:hypothetical protein [Micromonospora tarensis]MBM0275790.1 hypothetical protein [Micromonospora tarensis]
MRTVLKLWRRLTAVPLPVDPAGPAIQAREQAAAQARLLEQVCRIRNEPPPSRWAR